MGWDEFIYTVEIPANTSATVILPGANLGELKVNSTELNDELKSTAKQVGKEVKLNMGSGKYVISYPFAGITLK